MKAGKNQAALAVCAQTKVIFPFNPHLPNGLFHPYQLDESVSNFRNVWCTVSFFFFVVVSNRNSCKQTV